MSGWGVLSSHAFLKNQRLSDSKLFNGLFFSFSVSCSVSHYTLGILHIHFLDKAFYQIILMGNS